MTLNAVYKKMQRPDVEFWREMGVSIDSINERSDDIIKKTVRSLFENESNPVLTELLQLYGEFFEKKEDTTKELLINSLMKISIDDMRELLTLRDFQNRRKQSINIYYQFFSMNKNVKYISSLAKLKHILNNSFSLLIELYTLHAWSIKSTGSRYTYEKGLPLEKALKVPGEYKSTLVNHLFEKTGKSKKYKVFSFLKISKEVIFILYKQINDSPRADFDRAVRNKEVVPVMVSIDTEEKIIEIKGAVQTDQSALIDYFKTNFDKCHPTPIKLEVFERYNPEKVSNAFIEGTAVSEDPIEDFIVNKIEFRESPIQNSPSLTMELENEDIWPSVKYAYNNNCVNLESLKDIKSLSLKSENKSRVVRSVLLDNGNVLFTMDDSRLKNSTKNNIIGKFEKKFGVPINQEVVNSKFNEGKADKIDYLMGISSKSNKLTEESENLFKELIERKLIKLVIKNNFICKICKLEKEIDDAIPSECPECGNNKLEQKEIKEQKLVINEVKKRVKEKLNSVSGYTLSSYEPTMNIGENEYKFLKLENNDPDKSEIIQCLVTNESIPTKHINRIKTMMTPTIIIFVGYIEKNIESYTADCIQATTFGNIFIREEREFGLFHSKLVEKLRIRQRSYVHNAASLAEESLGAINSIPSNTSMKYNDRKFEDDVYAIIKDIFPNSEKWGKEKSGKAVPEGVFAISYIKTPKSKQEKKKVFSYDCKFTRDDNGYNLKKEEKRKAVDYVELLNDNPIIQNYSDSQELTGHIFISNKFKSSQLESVRDHFYKKLGEDSNARIIFLELEVLIHLYTEYRNNYQQILNTRNLFSRELIRFFAKENINKEDVDILFERVLNNSLVEYPQLDTDSVDEFLEDF